MSLRVILADDHPIVRQGCRSLLERAGFEVAGEAANGHDAVRLAQAECPDMAILDISMPLLNGLDAAQAILRRCNQIRIIVLSEHAEDYHIAAALRAGILGYVHKTQAAHDLIQAIQVVADGGIYLNPVVSRAVVDGYLSGTDVSQDVLAPRERQTLQLVAEGKTTKEAASLLGITVKSAESYRTRIMEKLQIHNTAGLVHYAIRRGLVEP